MAIQIKNICICQQTACIIMCIFQKIKHPFEA